MAIGSKELLEQLRIDPKFRDKIPPLTDAEFEQLRENIIEAGEVYEPIRVWNGVVVDGHNRLKVVREHPEIKWSTKEMDFVDEWAAFDWMYRNQLGRRNLTDEQRRYMIGKMYEARKNSAGGDRRSEVFSSSQKENMKNGRAPRTDEIIGEELGVNHSTVNRSYKFAKGVDALREVSPEAADKVMSGESKSTNEQVASLAGAARESLEQAAREINEGKKLSATTTKKPKSTPKSESKDTAESSSSDAEPKKRGGTGNSAESRELYRVIESANASMRVDKAEDEFNIDDLLGEIRDNGEMFVRALRSTIENRKHLLTDRESKNMVSAGIGHIIQEITIVRGVYTK